MFVVRKSTPRGSRIISPPRRYRAFALVLFIIIHAAVAVTQSREFLDSRAGAAVARYCDFSSSGRMFNVTDLLQCMNELASTAVVHSRTGRSSEDREYFFPTSKKDQTYPSANYRYSQRQTSDYPGRYERRPTRVYSGPGSYPTAQSGYYNEGFKYPYPNEQPFGVPSGVGAGLFDALASIAQYDDLKCVPRILCEVATGVIPGSSGYKQNYNGGNSLISLLAAVDAGESSPILAFGKSVLTGYTNRGNPGICYQEYPKCPRSNAKLVNYLNNHNGGFFRFFNDIRGAGSQGSYFRETSRKQHASPPRFSETEADRTGTGDLKFDSSSGVLSREFIKSLFVERKEVNGSNKITFPEEPLQEEQSLNRVSKSLMDYRNPSNDYQNPSFFPQDRKDPNSNALYGSNPSVQPRNRQDSTRNAGSRKARLYVPEDVTNETISTFTFPDGQKVQINVAFSKLFSDTYKMALRRSFANDHSPQPVNWDGYSLVDLVELFPNDGNRHDLRVVHPCDMVCHDSKAAIVQFNQILLHSGSLSTLMTPDRPILDLSNVLPCEIMCIDRRGERRQMSTTLNQVLRSNHEQQTSLDMTGFQDDWNIREYRSLKQPQRLRPSKDHGPSSQSQSYTHDIGQRKKKASSISGPVKAASVPQGSILFGDGQMPFFGSPIPFMGVAEVAPRSPPFFPQGPSGAMGLAIQPLPMPMPMQPTSGIMQSLMMPVLPRIIPMVNSITGIAGVAGITGQYGSQKYLIMCGGVIYFIPFGIFGGLPFCAILLSHGNSTEPQLKPDLSEPEVPSKPGLTDPETVSKPDIAHPETISQPDHTDPPSISKPDFIDPVTITRPEIGDPDITSKPDVGHHHVISKPNISGVAEILELELDNSYTVSTPGLSDPHPILKPDLHHPEITPSFPTHEMSPAQSPPSEDKYETVSQPLGEILVTTTPKFRRPEGEDYPQQSCLEGESWNLDTHECVPIKYDPDIELDYTHLPGSPWSGVTRKPIKSHKLKKRKKLVLITDRGNITYIKAV